ncbi:MAG TPA: efflux RND transporter permease subunit [Candidatus Acidoferrum sp.]|jgi:HAE1 family hydrophobic/amphiphilic exporter-1|nr:efflux RND transporter permease subunit [Candidatus Acidoferrum sp.]
MSRFALKFPYFIIVACLITCVLGGTSLVRMPVDLFPPIKIPVVVVATFYSGMPPEQVENDITGQFERMFTLATGVDHMESRSLMGVSLIKVYFLPGSNPDSDVTSIANLALASLRYLPEGTLPPIVMKFDASSLPVCLVTLKGKGLSEAQLRDLGQFTVRNQMAGIPGASVPPAFGGRYRQIMVYVDPLKLEAHQLSVMDVVHAVNQANLILPAGDVKIGPYDYNVFVNNQINKMQDLNQVPIKTVTGSPRLGEDVSSPPTSRSQGTELSAESSVVVADVGKAMDASQIQYNKVRINGQPSVYVPIIKSGGDANTIVVVNGVKRIVSHLLDVPDQLITQVVFDQSKFVRTAIDTLVHEGAIGLLLTGLMILIFLGSARATLAVFLSIPLSALAAFFMLGLGGSSVNAMILGGLALAFSRLIDNSVVVLENIFRHLELGESPEIAAERGGKEVQLAVLAATLATVIVFFPVTFLYGVSRFLFSALALAVVLSLFASYFVAMTVVPLFCAKLIRHGHDESGPSRSRGARFNHWFNHKFKLMLDRYEGYLNLALLRPAATILGIIGIFILSLGLYPFIGKAYFPRTDPGQFVINVKAQSGTRLELTEQLVAQVEQIVRDVVPTNDLQIIVSNIGTTPGFNSILNPNSCPSTAVVQVGLNDGHKLSSFEYMNRVRARVQKDLPEVSAYFQAGGLVDAVVNQGVPAPIDVKVSSPDVQTAHDLAAQIADKVRTLPGVSDVLVPQDVDYPSLLLDINRERASELGLNAQDIIDSLITSLTSDQMISPSYWIDPKTGNPYFLTVQYPENFIHNLADLGSMPLHAPNLKWPTRLDSVVNISHIETPAEVDHYQIRRTVDVYVQPSGEALNGVYVRVKKIVGQMQPPKNTVITIRGSVQAMLESFKSFALGLILSTLLVYLILVAQFKSFLDPFLILLAVPTGLTGVLLVLFLTGTTLNIMSLMGIVMMVGIVVSNSILIVEFTRRLREDGLPLHQAVSTACRVRLRPVLMTSLATLIGLVPMALKLGAGSETYAPLARAIIGGLAVSVVLTVFIVPCAYFILYRHSEKEVKNPGQGGAVSAH